MSTFKQKSLFAALAGMGVLGIADSAQAVHINQDGLDQALVDPYHVARGSPSNAAYTTALSVVNATSQAKAVQVRFLEGKNAREALDLNVLLSQFDVWTATIAPKHAGIEDLELHDLGERNKRILVSAPANDPLLRTYDGYFEIIETPSELTNYGGTLTKQANLDALPVHGGMAA